MVLLVNAVIRSLLLRSWHTGLLLGCAELGLEHVNVRVCGGQAPFPHPTQGCHELAAPALGTALPKACPPSQLSTEM